MAGQPRGGTLRPQDERRLKDHQANCDEIGRIADWLRANLPELERRAQQPIGPDGYPADVGYTSGGGSGGVYSPVETVIVNGNGRAQYDPVREAASFTISTLSQTLGVMRTARNLTERALATPDPMRTEERAGAGACINCGHLCTGVDPDRIKQGRCPACYIYWWRHDHTDRKYEPIEGAA